MTSPSKATEKRNVLHQTEDASLLSIFRNIFASGPSTITCSNSLNGSSSVEDHRSAAEVLAAIADDLLTSPVSDDIFDDDDDDDEIIEPVPLDSDLSRVALLEETLDQVINIGLADENFFAAAPSPEPVVPKRTCDDEDEPEQDCRSTKRQKADAESEESRFRSYQAEQWSDKFAELLEFKKERGHCNVPHTFQENPSLARWVKRQRYQYKVIKLDKGVSTLTEDRVQALERVGFVWDSHSAAWYSRLNDLEAYRQAHGHCNVPSNYPENPPLSTWVKCQRRQYKLFQLGNPCNMSLERIEALQKLGFDWISRRALKSSCYKADA